MTQDKQSAGLQASGPSWRGSDANIFIGLAVLSLLLGIALVMNPPGEQGRAVVGQGDAVVPFELPHVNREGVLSWGRDLAGRVVVVNFWATWCPPCIEEMPALDRLHRKLHEEGLTVVAISEDDSISLPTDFIEKTPVSFPVVHDAGHRVANTWGTFRYPETYVVGRDGVVKRKVFGPADWDAPQAIEYFRGLLEGGGVAAPSDAPAIPYDPEGARSPERGSMRQRAEERGGAPGTAIGQ